MNITQQDIQKARPSKAGRWPERACPPAFTQEAEAQKKAGLAQAPRASPDRTRAKVPGRAPSCCPQRSTSSQLFRLVLTTSAGSCSGSSIWIYLVLQRGQEESRVTPQAFPEEGACGAF